jgi:hypothetical protein
VALVGVLAIGLVGLWLGGRAFLSYRGIERVDLSEVLDPVEGDYVNWLLVGSDSGPAPSRGAAATRSSCSGPGPRVPP